ncbi:MAG: hypothetical protein QXL43_00355 [Methanolinea sp.]|nr:hypothetical protein [Methanolinea sp.]
MGSGTPRVRDEKGTGAGPVVLLLLLVIPIAFTAGCTGDQGERPPVVGAPPLLVDYSRTGGIAGFSDRMVIYSDGQAVYQTRQKSGSFVLDPDEMERLERLLRDVEAAGLNGTYPAPSPGADYFTYTLVIGNRTIVTETTGVPDALAPLLEFLEQVLGENRNKE